MGIAQSPLLARGKRPAWARWPGLPAIGAAIEACFVAEQHRWALWLPAALAAGIALYFGLPFEPSDAATVVVGGVAVCLVIASRLDLPALFRALLGTVAAICVGFTAATVRERVVAAPFVMEKMGPMGLDGRIETIELREKGLRVVLGELHSWRFHDAVPTRVRITLKAQTRPIVPGQWVHIMAVLMPPPPPAAPGDYDFGRRAFFAGLGGVGYSYGEATPIAPLRGPALTERINAGLERLRNAMTARIRAVLPGPEGAIAAALITGDQSSVDPADVRAYRDAGLTHVLSISGLHLALAGGIFFWVVRALFALFPVVALNYPIKKWAAVAALAGSGFYLLISGCEAPAVRSFIMLATMFTAILVDRPAITMRSVALSAGLILLVTPENAISPGFQMSFSAVVGLVAFGEWEASRARDEVGPTWFGRVWRYFKGIAVASIVATVATAPFVIFHFDRSAQYGIVSNLLTLPIATFLIMPAATAAMVLMPFGLERLPLLVMAKGVVLMSRVAGWTASFPGAALLLPAWPIVALLLVVFGGLWIALWRKRWRWCGLVPIAIGVALALMTRPPDLLFDQDGMTVAVRGADGRLGFVTPPHDAFAAQAWLRRDGDERLPADALADDRSGLRCDDWGCIANLSGRRVAVALRPEALSDDCARAQIVVSMVGRSICNHPLLTIDRDDVARNGTYAVWFGSRLTVLTTQDWRGDRPWSQPTRFGR